MHTIIIYYKNMAFGITYCESDKVLEHLNSIANDVYDLLIKSNRINMKNIFIITNNKYKNKISFMGEHKYDPIIKLIELHDFLSSFKIRDKFDYKYDIIKTKYNMNNKAYYHKLYQDNYISINLIYKIIYLISSIIV